jgi:hypothetical protein
MTATGRRSDRNWAYTCATVARLVNRIGRGAIIIAVGIVATACEREYSNDYACAN